MSAEKVKLLVLAGLSANVVSIAPALAGTPVPAPILGAGLPALALLAGGYWLIRRILDR